MIFIKICRSSFFIVGFYTLAIVCMALIIRFGVLDAVDPPSETLKGLFVLSCVVAGIIGGGFAIFFWKGTKYFIGAWGGFAFGLFIQCLHDNGLIEPLGFRYFLYIGTCLIHVQTSAGRLNYARLCCPWIRALYAPATPLSGSSGVYRYGGRVFIYSRSRLLHKCRAKGKTFQYLVRQYRF